MVYDPKAVYMRCDCGCCVMEITRTDFEDMEPMYDVAILDSRYDHEANGVWSRVKRAAKALFGKPVYFNDCTMSEEKFGEWLDELRMLREGK